VGHSAPRSTDPNDESDFPETGDDDDDAAGDDDDDGTEHPNKLYEGLVFVGSKSKAFAIDEQSLVTLVEVMLLGARHDNTCSFQDNEEQLAMVGQGLETG
jgi:hypothetical protein